MPDTGGEGRGGFTIEGTSIATWKLRFAPFIETYGDYFGALGIPLIAGRSLTVHDRSDAPLVCIVDESMAKQEWPGQSPIGKRLHLGNPKRTLPWATVVGVVRDVRIDAPDQPAGEQWYFPMEQPAIIEGPGASDMLDLSSGWIAVRSTLPPEQMIHTLRTVVTGIDPRLSLDPVQPLTDAISSVEAPRRFNTGLITVFALAALLLAAMGIYAIIAFSASQRTQEIAVRVALGAQRGNIARLVLSSGIKIAAAGCALGILGSLAVSRIVGAFLFEVTATNPIVYGASVVLMLALALLASALPALRAATADPVQALRSE
jgi:putative ABC transport system permease protein